MAEPELPSGTVTFLFTDIEGSTRLLHQLGQLRYDELLTAHQEILGAAFALHGGRVVDTQGDSFFVAFRTANDAVAAAVDGQRDLTAHRWPEGAEIRVRMGMHTGEPRVGQERYVGIGVHRAARIGAAGHGGQVLLSWTTKGLAEEDLPAGVTIRDLGERRLKDIEQQQHLYQLVIEGLSSDFGPLKTLDVELRRRRRRMYVGSALIGVLAAAVAIPVFALAQGGSSGRIVVTGNAVAVIDPSSAKVVSGISVGARPNGIAFGSGSLWVANLDDQSVSRIDPATQSVTRTFPVPDTPTGLAATPGATWVVGADPPKPWVSVRRIDTRFDALATKVIRIGNVITGGPGSAAASGGVVWIAPSAGLLTRLDSNSEHVTQTVDPNAGPSAVAIGAGATWVTDGVANTVTRVDSAGLLTPIPVGQGPRGIAVGAGGVWVADSQDNAVVRIDPATNTVTTTIPVGEDPAGITVGAGSVWVANSGDGTVTRIDPTGVEKPKTVTVGGSPQDLVVADGRVWVTVANQAIPASTVLPGGTLRLRSSQDPVDFIDPALAFFTTSWQLLDATCAKLLNYPDKPAPAGSLLAPEIAESLPARSRDGRAYTFTIRKGYRFSPPSNEPVTAETFKSVIERTLSPVLKSPAQSYMGDIVGAKAYMSGEAAHISGVSVRGDKLVVRLVAPAPDLPARLAMPFFCAVPRDTPRDPKGVRVIPSAGPYYVASYTPSQSVVLIRNPNYHGSRPHHVDRIEVTVGGSQQRLDAAIAAGTADYQLNGAADADAAKLTARFGPGSSAARSGRQQYFANPSMSLQFIVLNTHRPLFSDARLRRAVNYAVDRTALIRVGMPNGQSEKPTDQLLPPGMPGFEDADIYPFTPDVPTAKRLAGKQSRTAILYTCNTAICDQLTQILTTNLTAIGIHIVPRKLSAGALGSVLGRKGEPFDIGIALGWNADYPDPDDFLNLLLGEGATQYIPAFDDPAYQRKVAAIARLSGPRRYLAYGKLDVETSRTLAPWIPVGNTIDRDFFSARIGCQVYQPVYGMDLAALCIKR